MQFIPDGPEIPEEVLQYLEDDELVLFCGAGVSMTAGLPGFNGLVKKVYKKLNRPCSANTYPIEHQLFNNGNYDRCLGQLELSLDNSDMRKQVIKACSFKRKADMSLHEAILTLSSNKKRQYRLVTTNFDRGFTRLNSKNLPIDKAPLLRAPKKTTWNNPVYLHGLIEQSDPEGKNLVITSADFGMAYLTERWASQFVTELFKRFHVIFIGYSVKDPVFRYLMDALAADRKNGEKYQKAYIFTSESEIELRILQSQGIIPISYQAPSHDHSLLHKTLKTWASSRSLDGKKSIISKYALNPPPTGLKEQSHIVKQIRWALSDKTDIPTKHFASIAHIDWLPIIYDEGLLTIIGIKKENTFPIIQNNLQHYLIDWLLKFLNNDALIRFIASKGGILHPLLAWGIEGLLHGWKDNDKEAPLAPRKERFWRICILISSNQNLDFHVDGYQLIEDICNGETEISVLMRFQNIFRPLLRINKPWSYRFNDNDNSLSALARVEVDLEHSYGLKDYREKLLNNRPKLLQPIAISALTLLEQTFHLMWLGEIITPDNDLSYIHIPSVEHNPEVNHYHQAWGHLPPLIFEAAKYALDKNDIQWVMDLLGRINLNSFPMFTRISLAIYSLLVARGLSIENAKKKLQENNFSALWNVGIQNEMYVLLKSLVESKNFDFLITAIINGPDRTLYRKEMTEQEWQDSRDRRIYNLLHKIIEYGGDVSTTINDQLSLLQTRHPEWKPSKGKNSEYPYRLTSGWKDKDESVDIDFASMSIDDCINTLSQKSLFNKTTDSWCAFALKEPEKAYEVLNNAISHDKYNSIAIQRLLTGYRAIATDKDNQESATALTNYWKWILENDAVTKEVSLICSQLMDDAEKLEEEMLFKIAELLISPASKSNGAIDSGDSLTIALNHPAGELTIAVMNTLWRTSKAPESLIPANYQQFFERIMNASDSSSQVAISGIMGAQASVLYRVDSNWTNTHILPLFDWQSITAKATWEGFLHQLRLYPSFISKLKSLIISFGTSTNLNIITQGLRRRFYKFIAIIVLDLPDIISTNEAYQILIHTPDDCKSAFLDEYKHRLETADDPNKLWSSPLKPLIQKVWPKDIKFQTSESSSLFTELFSKLKNLSITQLGEFKAMLVPQIGRVNLGNSLHVLENSECIKSSPESVIYILDRIFSHEADRWDLQNMQKMVSEILKENPALHSNSHIKSIKNKLESVGLILVD